jgi:hypothetical protein
MLGIKASTQAEMKPAQNVKAKGLHAMRLSFKPVAIVNVVRA